MSKIITTGSHTYRLFGKNWMIMGEDGGVVDYASECESCLLDSIAGLENKLGRIIEGETKSDKVP